MNMKVTQGTIDDLDGISRMFDCYRQFYGQESQLEQARAFIRERMECEQSVIFVVKQGQNYCGFAQLYPSFSSISMKKMWILNDLYVDGHHRRIGVGQILLDEVKAFAKRTEAKGISLSTALDNKEAQRLYIRNGYKRDDHFLSYELVV